MRTTLFVPFRSICFVRVPFYAQFFILPQHSDNFSRILRNAAFSLILRTLIPTFLQIYRDVVDKWCISARFRFYIVPRNFLAAEDRNIFYEIVSHVERVLNLRSIISCLSPISSIYFTLCSESCRVLDVSHATHVNLYFILCYTRYLFRTF